MPARPIDGRAVAARIIEEARAARARLDRAPGLAVILVGDDPASHLYVRLKQRACADVGIRFERFLFRADAPERLVLRAVGNLNRREDVDAILVQLPLPAPLDEGEVIAAIDPAKDVDGFHPENVAALRDGRPGVVPGLGAGIVELLRATGERLEMKEALVVANSTEFYEPLAVLLARERMTPAFRRADDHALADAVRTADVLIVAAGRPGLITGGMLKPGCIVVDVGTNRVDGALVGDVDAASAAEVAGHLTPVPGGVGPVTVAMLVRNAVALASKKRR